MQNIPRSEPICITSKLVNVKEVSISSIFLFFIFIRILVGFGQPDKKNRFWPQVKVVDHTILLGKWENRGSNLRISETMKKKGKEKTSFWEGTTLESLQDRAWGSGDKATDFAGGEKGTGWVGRRVDVGPSTPPYSSSNMIVLGNASHLKDTSTWIPCPPNPHNL